MNRTPVRLPLNHLIAPDRPASVTGTPDNSMIFLIVASIGLYVVILFMIPLDPYFLVFTTIVMAAVVMAAASIAAAAMIVSGAVFRPVSAALREAAYGN